MKHGAIKRCFCHLDSRW